MTDSRSFELYGETSDELPGATHMIETDNSTLESVETSSSDTSQSYDGVSPSNDQSSSPTTEPQSSSELNIQIGVGASIVEVVVNKGGHTKEYILPVPLNYKSLRNLLSMECNVPLDEASVSIKWGKYTISGEFAFQGVLAAKIESGIVVEVSESAPPTAKTTKRKTPPPASSTDAPKSPAKKQRHFKVSRHRVSWMTFLLQWDPTDTSRNRDEWSNRVNSLKLPDGSPAYSPMFNLGDKERDKEPFKYGGKCLWTNAGTSCNVTITWTDRKLFNLEAHLKIHKQKADDVAEEVEAEGSV